MLTLQNLRAESPGVQPQYLSPGQLCFNVSDKVMFVGDGTDNKTSYDGTVVPGVPGLGWFSTPLSFNEVDNYYVVNPAYYGDVPLDNQVLTWDAGLNRVVWRDSPAPVSYLTTNAAVAAAPGVDVSSKISNALGITPSEGDSAIVSGVSGDTYQALYQFVSGNWVYAASYAPPLASEVPVDPIPGLTATNTQNAIVEVFGEAQAAQTTASNALTVANNALPKTGGTMSGNIQFTDGQPVDAGSF